MGAHFDVVIAGGGPVGAALALALEDCGHAIGLVTPQSSARVTVGFRPIALSHASRSYLLGLAPALALDTTPIHTVHVSQRGGFGRTVMTAREHALPALGHVADLASLSRAVLARAAPIDGRVSAWTETHSSHTDRIGNHRMDIRLEHPDGTVETCTTALLVRADGGADAQPDANLRRDYAQTAITALIRTEAPPRNQAWERFTPDGPLALLPFHDRYALVWAVPTARASDLMAASDASFLGALEAAFGGRVGRFLEVASRASSALVLKQASSSAEPGVIAIGNAAQTLHPVAGQGLNLALRDVAELARLIRDTPRGALGDLTLQRAFTQARRADRFATIEVTDRLVRIFSNDDPPIRIARGIGLALLDTFPPARRFFARRMMLGLRGLP